METQRNQMPSTIMEEFNHFLSRLKTFLHEKQQPVEIDLVAKRYET